MTRKRRRPSRDAVTNVAEALEMDMSRAWEFWPSSAPEFITITEGNTYYEARNDAAVFFACSPLDLQGQRVKGKAR